MGYFVCGTVVQDVDVLIAGPMNWSAAAAACLW